jgi:hypothetical protein
MNSAFILTFLMQIFQATSPIDIKGLQNWPMMDSEEVNTDCRIFPEITRLSEAQEAVLTDEKLFVVRMWIHHNLKYVANYCYPEVRETIRGLRDLQERVEIETQKAPHLRPEDLRFLDETAPMINVKKFSSLKLNPFENQSSQRQKVDVKEFRPGDILITRGVSFLSSTISQIGDGSAPFSHLVFIIKDSNTGKLKTVESYFGSGVLQFDFDYALRNENARIMWLRPKNTVLAKAAADFVTNELERAADERRVIPYDYKMDFENHDRLSCAEVGRWGYEVASGGKFVLPYFPSNIDEAESFLHPLKLKNGVTFAPSDLELDPRFSIMGEWNDLRVLQNGYLKDALMSKVLDWMKERNYQLRSTNKSWTAGHLLLPLRRSFLWKPLKKMFKLPDIPKDTPRKSLEMLVKIKTMGDALIPVLEDYAFSQSEFPYKNELRGYLEYLLQKDLDAMDQGAKRKDTKILKFFRGE